ncbi:PepSY-associated TM helix domain-containing protein [Zavarzinia aquatilis]|uniref:PepSY domain-containing protein n=1 Tax=Zavarzinia aquatilis TaxID=2211142 RepID=A0A317E685_9PROT|nr:PepSY domain-containing protein [Zavarzinia aquatilis]PWR22527.1 hypothetical protein DKG74_11670 [Zavarzinia aquatilis]
MSQALAGTDAGDAARRRAHVYRAVWRWHFYAGLFSLPFLILLAVTGGLYLFKDEIDLARHADLLSVSPSEAPKPWSDLVATALSAQPGRAAKLVLPATPSRSLEVQIDDAERARQSVYVDPGRGAVLGALPTDGKLMQVVRKLHSLAFFGDIPNRAIEIVGGWTIVLVVTGIYLWWPRGGQALRIRGTPGGRLFWRDLHAVTGLFAGGFILFLAVTGMPWSGIFGDLLNRGVSAAGQGYPLYLWDATPTSTVPLGADGPVAWTLEQSPVPVSTPVPAARPIGIDRAVAIAGAAGIAPGFTLVLPKGAEGVYTATVFPDDITLQRAIHIDQYSGAILADVGFADYGLGARAIEFGTNVHVGQEFGPLNQMLMLLACVAIVGLSVSALVMWWKRRPAGGLAVPPLPAPRALAGVTAIVFALALIFPLTAASLVVVALLDTLFHLPALRARAA